MTDFGARIERQRRAEREREERTAFLRLELDRQLQALGQSLIEFRTQNGLAIWQEAWNGPPVVTWSMKRDSLFGKKYPDATLSGETIRVMRVMRDYRAFVTESGSWILGYRDTSFFHGGNYVLTPPSRSYLVAGGPISDSFTCGNDNLLYGAISEESDYGDRFYWHLDMTPTGTVGRSIGDKRYSLEAELTSMLHRELDDAERGATP